MPTSAAIPSILTPILSVRNEAIPPPPTPFWIYFFICRGLYLASYVSRSWNFHIRDLGRLETDIINLVDKSLSAGSNHLSTVSERSYTFFQNHLRK